MQEPTARGYDAVGTKYNAVAPPDSTLNPLTEDEKFRIKPNKPGSVGKKYSDYGTAGKATDAETGADASSSASSSSSAAAAESEPKPSKKRPAPDLPPASVSVAGMRPPQLRRPNVSTEDIE